MSILRSALFFKKESRGFFLRMGDADDGSLCDKTNGQILPKIKYLQNISIEKSID
ncbi:hypothetical protein GCM10007162_13480 [Ignatzschineria ureiclastica]|nr:hypothetical protein GCM10007162_13480 [Ignatzschineria ureiclastica]